MSHRFENWTDDFNLVLSGMMRELYDTTNAGSDLELNTLTKALIKSSQDYILKTNKTSPAVRRTRKKTEETPIGMMFE